jgi:glycine cleavage system H protein
MADEHYPAELRYHREHDWVRVEGEQAVFGITWFAQDALGEVVFFEPPAVGAQLSAGATYGELESVKAVSDIYAPADGEVIAINDDVVTSPELVNADPYGAGWLVRVRLTNPAGLEDLMDQVAYTAYLAGLDPA